MRKVPEYQRVEGEFSGCHWSRSDAPSVFLSFVARHWAASTPTSGTRAAKLCPGSAAARHQHSCAEGQHRAARGFGNLVRQHEIAFDLEPVDAVTLRRRERAEVERARR